MKKKISKTLQYCINISKKRIMVILVLIAITSIIYAYTRTSSNNIEETIMDIPQPADSSKIIWTPTEDDIAYQDSMFAIVEQTSQDVDTIKKSIEHILLRLDYKDGTYDSIRIVKRSNKNKENQSR